MAQMRERLLFSTYSILARDPESGNFGIGVQTHQMGVGRVVPWLLPGVGALVTQSMTNVSFGPIGLAMLQEGLSAPQVIDGLIASDPKAEFRQLAVVDSSGSVGAWTGSNCIPEAAHHAGDGYSVQANMMARSTVIVAMREAYENTQGRFADRLIAALEAAEGQGGDIRGMQSAALKIVPGPPPVDRSLRTWESRYDLRVDEHPTPLAELKRLSRLQTAKLVSDEGDIAFEEGKTEEGFKLWEEARVMAPELEEVGFWQAMTLADNYADIDRAAEILFEVLSDNPRKSNWLDLIGRLRVCGLLETDGIDQALLSKLGDRDVGDT